jgi:MAE_28990/MAE_18760-like HEPN
MTTLRASLEIRREEFDAHFALASALQDRMILALDAPIGPVNLSARHINTLKSGLIVHLYNIEEAIMSQALQYLGGALGSSDPRRWTAFSLCEWLREYVAGRITESNEEGRLETIFQKSNLLLTEAALGPQRLKKPSGTWDDKGIALFSQRMNVTFNMPAQMWQRIAASPAYGDKTPLQFLADRRNAIAHGRRSFEDGASDMRLADIRTLADIVLDYIGHAADAFQTHVDTDAHLVPAA